MILVVALSLFKLALFKFFSVDYSKINVYFCISQRICLGAMKYKMSMREGVLWLCTFHNLASQTFFRNGMTVIINYCNFAIFD